jgi:hypothetical protein
MSLQREFNEDHSFSEYYYEEEENAEQLSRKGEIRRLIEARLERNRLREELEDELDREFDWKDFDWDALEMRQKT